MLYPAHPDPAKLDPLIELATDATTLSEHAQTARPVQTTNE